jgi:hypothetical protein
MWSWKVRQDFQFYLKFAYWLKKQIMHNVISPKILRTRRIQRRYIHARPGASLWADGAYAIYGINDGTMTSTDTFPYSRFCLLFLVSKKSPIILKEIPA